MPMDVSASPPHVTELTPGGVAKLAAIPTTPHPLVSDGIATLDTVVGVVLPKVAPTADCSVWLT